MRMVQDTVEDRGSEDLVAEDRAPLGHQLVGGDERAGLFVASCNELKKEMGTAFLEGQIAQWA